MKLYYSKGACSLAPHILINELNVPCEYESVDLKSKITEKNENFLKINPKGAVPVIVTDNNEILTENAIILQFLADSNSATKLLPPTTDFRRYRVLEWLNYIATELHKGFGPLFNPSVPQEVKDQIFIPLIKKKLTFVNEHLKNKYLLGDDLTIPDIYLFVILRWLRNVNIDLNQWPNLSNYFAEFKKRPAVQKTFHEEGL